MERARTSRGFTLIELTVVLALLGLVAMLTAPTMMNDINQRRADLTIAETQTIVDAARSYRIANSVWPGDATCSNAITAMLNASPPVLAGITVTNKYNSAISTSCTAYTFSVDQNTADDWDGYIANSLAATEIVNSSTYQIRTTIGIPGSEPALDGKLSRLATGNAELNRMRTTLLLGGNDINEINNVSAVSGEYSGSLKSNSLTVEQAATISGMLEVNGQSQFTGKSFFSDELVLQKRVTEGQTGCTTGAIARDTTGQPLFCKSGTWTELGGGGELLLSSCNCTDCGFHTAKSCDPECPSGYSLASKVDSGDWSVSHNRHRIFIGICTK